jgi:hypothetical protein
MLSEMRLTDLYGDRFSAKWLTELSSDCFIENIFSCVSLFSGNDASARNEPMEQTR